MPDLTSAEADSVRIEATPTGPTASLRTPDGRWIRLHSGRDPVAEAEQRVASLTADGDPPLLICIGLGLGYILDAIERRSSATRVLAFEPMPAVARAMLARRTWHDWTTSGRLTLLVGPDYAGAAEASRCIGAHVSAPIVVAPVLEREFGAAVAEARDAVNHALFGARANAEARRAFAPRYVLNTIRNIPVIAGSADVSALDDTFIGVPAVVIAAGPSLDTNIDELRRLRGRALFIAVDTALRPLLDAGIAPELVIAIDPSEVNGRHLRNLPDTSQTWLVAEGSLEPAAFEQFAGRTFTFSVSDHHPWPWLRSIGLGRGRLRAWGSVITSAFDLALRAGCDPIVFAGADLAYPERRPYCRGTIYEQDWAMRAAGGESLSDIWQSVTEARATVMVDDVAGHPVPTASPLVAFRDWLVEQSVSCGDRQIFNATGGGALVGGRIQQRTLAEALAAGQGRPSPGAPAVREAWSRGRVATERATAPGGLAVTRTLAAIADAPGEEEPIASWLEFGSPDLTREAIAAAASRSAPSDRRAPSHRSAPSHQTSSSAVVRYAPERVLSIRAAIAGHPAGSGANPEPPAAALMRASELLTAILRTSGLLEDDPPPDDQRERGGVPGCRAFAWSPAATNLVLEYEAALAEMLACRYVPGDTAVQAVLERVQVTFEPEVSEAAGATGDTAPHLALVADWLSVVAHWDDARDGVLVRDGRVVPLRVAAALIRAHAEALRSGLESPSAERVIDALTGALVRVSTCLDSVPAPAPAPRMHPPALSIALPAGDGPQAVPISLSSRPHGAGDSAAGEPGPSWLRAARTERPGGWVPAIRLTGPDLPPCMVGNVLDASHALFTIVNGTHSVRVDAFGRWEPDHSWPGPITGQVPWSVTGAIAWHNSERPRVMWRERPDGDVNVEPMPFTGARACPQPDGSLWWTSTRGGLWSWTPGAPWQRLVDTPPILGLQAGADGVRLDARGDNLDFAVRNKLTEAFWWRPGSDAVETIPIGAEGPCWSTSSNGAWTALAYPHVDLIVLRHRSGEHCTLTCPYPFDVAWAGPSLVVSTGSAELLVFRDLLAWLEEM